ncbi:MAG: hypothetical protein Q9221_002390 [Calogaya cf. arnoldii]
MRFTSLLLLLTPLLALTLAGPVVRVHNTKMNTICLKVETSKNYGWFPTTTTCGGSPGIWVNARQTTVFRPSEGWNGAISDFTKAGTPGTRLEINFSKPGQTWYNADMEFGISSATLGPTDHRPKWEGLGRKNSLVGEQDPLAKANAAWADGKNRVLAPAAKKYLTPSKNGNKLVNVYMDKQAPQMVQEFFQLVAHFHAYMNPGSVVGQNPKGRVKKLKEVADNASGKVDGTQDMTITIY